MAHVITFFKFSNETPFLRSWQNQFPTLKTIKTDFKTLKVVLSTYFKCFQCMVNTGKPFVGSYQYTILKGKQINRNRQRHPLC